MKRAILLICLMALLSGCGTKITLPEEPVVFETKSGGEYLSIVWEDREYVPYCPLDSKFLGDCIGYYGDGDDITYVCEFAGLPSEAWLVDVINPDNCSEGMVWRESHVTEIPEWLESEYAWNP